MGGKKSKQKMHKTFKTLTAMKNMALPSPALLFPRNMNQYSSSLSTAVKKAWSSFTCLLGNCFAHSPLNWICAIWMLCVHICHHPLESEWQSRRFLGLPATSLISATGSSHSPETWHGGRVCPWKSQAGLHLVCCSQGAGLNTAFPSISESSLRLNFSVVFFLISLTPESQNEMPISSLNSLCKMEQLTGQTLLWEISCHMVVSSIFSTSHLQVLC